MLQIDNELEKQIQERGQQIFRLMEKAESSTSIFNRNWWYGQVMDWSMKNEDFKTQMFRFVDVLPTLKDGNEVHRHLREYFQNPDGELPKIFKVGFGLGGLAPGLMAKTIKSNVEKMASMFIVGETPMQALKVLKNARENKIAFTVDLLGEACLSEKEAIDYRDRYLDLMRELAREARAWKSVEILDHDDLGPIPRVNVSVKLSSLYSQIRSTAFEESCRVCMERLRPLWREAQALQIAITLDMENHDLKEITDEVFARLIMEDEFKEYPYFGCVLQAYRVDSADVARRWLELGQKRGVPFSIRLVKGAYWDYETVLAESRGWPCPVYLNKQETDANYEEVTRILMAGVAASERGEARPYLRLAIASHNVRSIAMAMVQAERNGLERRAIEIQMLYGMAEPIKRALVEMGYRVREYAPVGELLPGMAYLVRRLLENTSNESFLRSKFAEGTSVDRLLQNPLLRIEQNIKNLNENNQYKDSQYKNRQESPTEHNQQQQQQQQKQQQQQLEEVQLLSLERRFKNEPLIDWNDEKRREQMRKALGAVRERWKKTLLEAPTSEAPAAAGVVAGGARFIESRNPSQKSEILGRVRISNINNIQSDVDQVVSVARTAFHAWRKDDREDVEARCRRIERLADIIQRDRMEWIALEVLEVGKTWEEADGDVAEAIDFCRYYAEQMRISFAKPQRVGSVPGEISWYHYQPRGISVVIAPWNFPLAILCGMVAASLVTGNACIMKPAEQAVLIGARFQQALEEVGFPPGVMQLLQGYGEEVGEALTSHPEVNLICFTGSKSVGLRILQKVGGHGVGESDARIDRRHIPHCVIEMGGKNAIIIDNDADLDEAVVGVCRSAYGFAGQKCSAASRVIVLESVYDKFVERLVEAVRSLKQGASEDPSVALGPVVDEEAYRRICGVVEKAKVQGITLAYEGQYLDSGYYIPPIIFKDVDPNCSLAQDEIFGPVLAIIRVADLDQALDIANSTVYALTGGFYSRSPAHIDRVMREFQVGNLYINRSITGAMVARHPFGGLKMSGVGYKTGGPDYLRQFMEVRVICENSMRRGFAPNKEVAPRL